MEGLVSWGHAFDNQHVEKLPRGQKALTFLLKQVISLNEEKVASCFINEPYYPKVLCLVRGTSLELLMHSRISK